MGHSRIPTCERSTILELLAGKDESLLVRGDAFFILDLLLNVFDVIGRFHLD